MHLPIYSFRVLQEISKWDQLSDEVLKKAYTILMRLITYICMVTPPSSQMIVVSLCSLIVNSISNFMIMTSQLTIQLHCRSPWFEAYVKEKF